VVNESTLEVIGHVVATDELDDAYVIPFADIFKDIKTRLAAHSVELASPSSIRSVGAVPDSLNMIGAPHLDAIRGNGVFREMSIFPQDWAIIHHDLPRGTAGSDSGYGSTVRIGTTYSGGGPEDEDKEVLGLVSLAKDDTTPENVWYSAGKWIS
jgi:hypothetical protein